MAILFGLLVFFVVIALTIVFGGVSRLGDKRVAREGRPTADQRPPMTQGLLPERETPAT